MYEVVVYNDEGNVWFRTTPMSKEDADGVYCALVGKFSTIVALNQIYVVEIQFA